MYRALTLKIKLLSPLGKDVKGKVALYENVNCNFSSREDILYKGNGKTFVRVVFYKLLFQKHGIAAITANNVLNITSKLALKLNANRSLKYSWLFSFSLIFE